MTNLNSVSSFGGFDKNMIMILTEYYKNELARLSFEISVVSLIIL